MVAAFRQTLIRAGAGSEGQQGGRMTAPTLRPQGASADSSASGGVFWWELSSRQKARRTLIGTVIIVPGYISYCLLREMSVSLLVVGLMLGLNLMMAALYLARAREEEGGALEASVLSAPPGRRDPRAGFYAMTAACIAGSTLALLPGADIEAAGTSAIFAYASSVRGAALLFGLFALPGFYFVGRSVFSRDSSASSKAAAAVSVVVLAGSCYVVIERYNVSVVLADATKASLERGPPILLESDEYDEVHSQTALSQTTVRWDRRDQAENLIAVRTPFVHADATADLCDKALTRFAEGILRQAEGQWVGSSLGEPSSNERCRRKGVVKFDDGFENVLTAGVIPCKKKGGGIIYASFVAAGEEVRDPAKYLRCLGEVD